MHAFIGIILGFSVTGIFFIYAGIRIIIDELERTAYYKKAVAKCEEKLKEKYDHSADAILGLKEEFLEKDAGNKKAEVTEEDEDEEEVEE